MNQRLQVSEVVPHLVHVPPPTPPPRGSAWDQVTPSEPRPCLSRVFPPRAPPSRPQWLVFLRSLTGLLVTSKHYCGLSCSQFSLTGESYISWKMESAKEAARLVQLTLSAWQNCCSLLSVYFSGFPLSLLLLWCNSTAGQRRGCLAIQEGEWFDLLMC